MERAIAALSFFTRLPLWRVKEIGADAYKRVVELWPLAGWVTGSVAGGVYFAASFAFGPMIAAVMALSSRLLLTALSMRTDRLILPMVLEEVPTATVSSTS